jgi:predicted helicase
MGFVTNHAYIDGPTFRGMRQQLANSFDSCRILDLHGNAKKQEVAPDGTADQNVFDIQQGVAIALLARTQDRSSGPSVLHADLFGDRASKYDSLLGTDAGSTSWRRLDPCTPHYLWRPLENPRLSEYELGISLPEAMPLHSVGIVTSRDRLAVHFTEAEAHKTIDDFCDLVPGDARARFALGHDSSEWQVALAQADARSALETGDPFVSLAYRPFDTRFTLFTSRSRGFLSRPRAAVMKHMLKPNLALLTSRMTKGEEFAHVHVTRHVSEKILLSAKTSNNSFHFPLYSYESGVLAGSKAAVNLDTLIVECIESCVGYRLGSTIAPEDVFGYVYSILHSPAYRARYAEFLKIDFPRIPITSDRDLFDGLCRLGGRLVTLHLMEAADLPAGARFEGRGDNRVETIRYTDAGAGDEQGHVWINGTQHFEGVPSEVWNFHVGGYQVCDKWLKDRKGRKLTFDDLAHYQYIVAALTETAKLMTAIDELIEGHGGWPIH